MSGYRAWFQCINDCGERFSLFDVIYRCPKCGDLLEVAHDVEALKTAKVGQTVKFTLQAPDNLIVAIQPQ